MTNLLPLEVGVGVRKQTSSQIHYVEVGVRLVEICAMAGRTTLSENYRLLLQTDSSGVIMDLVVDGVLTPVFLLSCSLKLR